MVIFRYIRGITCSCLILLLLLGSLLIGWLLFALATPAWAQALPAHDIVLISDHSLSNWQCDDGPGTDPQQLRVQAVQLFINYLGADAHNARFRLALFHFGGEVSQVAPLTDLGDEAMRRQLAQVAADPQPIPWTDQLAALRSAHELLRTTGDLASRRTIILLTDGDPQFPRHRLFESNTYRQDLYTLAAQFANDEADLFVVHLTNPESPCSQRALAEWVTLWAELAQTTPRGALYTATKASDLLPIYHAIVRDLSVRDTGNVAASQPLLDDEPLRGGEPLIIDVMVEGPLTSMTFIILKQDPTALVQVDGPASAMLEVNARRVTVTGAHSRQEIWRFEDPLPGRWRVILTGEGTVTVWQDRIWPAFTPTATQTATSLPTNTPPPSPTATSTPRPTFTSTPTLTPTATDSPTATPSNTSTSTPSATPTPTQAATNTPLPPTAPATPMTPQETTGRSPWWTLLFGFGLVVLVGIVGSMAWLPNGPYLTGQLLFLTAPDEGLLPLPLELGGQRLKQIVIGAKGRDGWRLMYWSGAFRITIDRQRQILLSPESGDVSVNSIPARGVMPLQHGDIIDAGPYRLRYENLLL